MVTCPLTWLSSWSFACTLWWLSTPLLKFFDDRMLTIIDFHLFDIHTHLHTLGWWNVYRLEGKSNRVVGHSCAHMLWCLCLNVEVVGRFEVCVLRCLNAHKLICYPYHMLVCSHTLLITSQHIYLLWRSNVSIFTCFVDHKILCSHASMIVCSHVYMLW